MVLTDVQIAFVRKPSWLSTTVKPVNHFSAVYANFPAIEYKKKINLQRLELIYDAKNVRYNTQNVRFTFNIRFCF